MQPILSHGCVSMTVKLEDVRRTWQKRPFLHMDPTNDSIHRGHFKLTVNDYKARVQPMKANLTQLIGPPHPENKTMQTITIASDRVDGEIKAGDSGVGKLGVNTVKGGKIITLKGLHPNAIIS